VKDATDMVDLLVVGGGVNGAGIACDAAGRGLTVALVEQDDLASATSSASSKLIHGGLRYLEYYEFRLVRESLAEREVLLAKAPHIVRPLRFVLPHHNIGRPAWMVRLGLFLYDHLAPHPSLPGSRGLDLGRDPAGRALKETLTRGFEYFDCWVDDARLVVLNAMQAAHLGARIMTRTRLVGAERGGTTWQARLEDRRTGRTFAIAARALVNAAGPWAGTVARNVLGMEAAHGTEAGRRGGVGLRLVKGSHIVVPRLHDDDHAYILQNSDGRVVFVIPFRDRFSLIGTTEAPFEGDPAGVVADDDERDYLIAAVNAYFASPVRARDVVWSFAGVRPLFGAAGTPTAVTRDYALEADVGSGAAPAITVLGGKITTYRRLAEKVLAALAPRFPDLGRPWTADAPLPGGALRPGGMEVLVEGLVRDYPDLDPDLLRALAGRHGTLARDVLGDARGTIDLGQRFGEGLYKREVDYMVEREWAETADDVMWRRTKAGLVMDAGARAALADYMARSRGLAGEASAHAAP